MKYIDRRAILGGLAAVTAAFSNMFSAFAQTPVLRSEVNGGDPAEAIDLWPNKAFGMPAAHLIETVTERSKDPRATDRAMTGITSPRMIVIRPEKPNGAAILIMPGGGYQRIAIDVEGYDIARRMIANGITVFILIYRLPGEGWENRSDVPLSDAQRAMRLIRARAADYQVDPKRVGAMGFSAGGHLCAELITRYDARVYRSVDSADRLSARPYLAALIYPVVAMASPTVHGGSKTNLLGEVAYAAMARKHSPQDNVTAETPPCFIVHAEDDQAVKVENSLLFRAALKAKGVAVETHLFTDGGHGFGIRRVAGNPAAVWVDLFLTWGRSRSFFAG